MQNIQPTSHHTSLDTVFTFRYQPVKKHLFHPDLGHYTSYGLQLFYCEQGHVQPLRCIDDISINQEFVESLAVKFTMQQLSPIHFLEAVIDTLP